MFIIVNKSYLFFVFFYSGMSCKLTRSPSFLSLTLGQGSGLGRLPAAFAPDPASQNWDIIYLLAVSVVDPDPDPHGSTLVLVGRIQGKNDAQK
jgi:hypothetical protein